MPYPVPARLRPDPAGCVKPVQAGLIRRTNHDEQQQRASERQLRCWTDTNNLVSIPNGASNVTIQDSDISGGCNCNSRPPVASSTYRAPVATSRSRTTTSTGWTLPPPGPGATPASRRGSDDQCHVANNNIYFCSTGLNQIDATNGAVIIDGNYIHDSAWGDSAKSNHMDGIQFEGGGSANSPTDFVNNTDLQDMQQTDAVILSNDNNLPNKYRWIAHNLLAGGDVSSVLRRDGDISHDELDVREQRL